VTSARKLLAITAINIGLSSVAFISIELLFGGWLKSKPFVPNILPKQGISHDLRLMKKTWGITTRIPDSDGLVRFLKSKKSKGSKKECSLLILGGSTSEERILNKQDTWGHRLYQSLNEKDTVRKECPDGFGVTNAAVNGHSIVANYFDILFWISRSKQAFGSAVIYQGINDFQGDLLETPDWYDQYWQYITFVLRYNSILFNLATSTLLPDTGWSRAMNHRNTILVTPHKKHIEQWRSYRVTSTAMLRLSTGLDNHGSHIERVANALRVIGVNNIIWITQTKPFCDLRKMPYEVSVKGASLKQSGLDSLHNWGIQDLKYFLAHDRVGDCLRLGLIRRSYVETSRRLARLGITSSVVDYGSLVESDSDSYDDYHKSPEGSRLLWGEFERMGLPEKIVNYLTIKNQ